MAGAFALLAACSGDHQTPGGAPNAGESEDDAVNLDLWLERMEVSSRELYSARDAVVAAVNAKPGDVIADVGAGTGLYTLLFADAVGPDGHVFAVDIEPLFLDLINRRTEDTGFANVSSVLGLANSITLPENSVDIVFIADSYHYFGDREALMESAKRALKPGGSLILIEYDITPGETRPDFKSHVRFGKAGVISEIEFFGFEKSAVADVSGLEESYFVRFLKP